MIFVVHTHVYVSAHNAKWAAKVRLFFEMTKFFFEKMQKILRFVRYICIYAIFVVISARPFPYGVGSLRRSVRVLRDICKVAIFFASRSFRRSDYNTPSSSTNRYMPRKNGGIRLGKRTEGGAGDARFRGACTLSAWFKGAL